MATTSACQLGKTHLALLSAAAQRQDRPADAPDIPEVPLGIEIDSLPPIRIEIIEDTLVLPDTIRLDLPPIVTEPATPDVDTIGVKVESVPDGRGPDGNGPPGQQKQEP